LRISETDDEIERYLQGRYIGPTEAFARIFEYKMHEEDPTVTTLALHLPNEQPVYYAEDATREQIEEIMRNSRSMLMAYFKYNDETPPVFDRNGNQIKHLYHDFPQHFRWMPNRTWRPRKQGTAIGRVPYCSPVSGERYF